MILHLALNTVNVCNIGNRPAECSQIQYATGYTRHFCGKVQKIIVNIKKSATVFVYNDAFNIARSVRNVSSALCYLILS